MIKYLTLRHKLDYSLPAIYSSFMNNFWSLLCWAFGTYLLPVYSLVFIMFFMVVVDLITGIWKSIKLYGYGSIRSKRIGDTVEKSILYMIGIITSFVLQNHLGIGFFKITWFFGTLIITREYLSVIENIEIITGTKILFLVKKYLNKNLPDHDDTRSDKKTNSE